VQWEQIYAELLNKFRWGIASTMAGQGSNYSYAESIALAGALAGDALRLMKLKEEKPDLRLTTEGVKRILRDKV